VTQLTTEKKPEFIAPIVPTINTVEQYESTAGLLKDVKAYRDRVEAFFAPHKDRAHKAWKGLVDEEKKALAPALQAEADIKAELSRFHSEQEAARREQQRVLEEQARRREEQARLEEAAALELEAQRTGDTDLQQQAEELVNTPVETPTVQVASFTPKVSGLSFRETWSARVDDLKKLIAWVAKNPADFNLLQPNTTALNAKARSQKSGMNVDGVKAVCTKTPASGR
jgi:chromosome segregation ATPase